MCVTFFHIAAVDDRIALWRAEASSSKHCLEVLQQLALDQSSFILLLRSQSSEPPSPQEQLRQILCSGGAPGKAWYLRDIEPVSDSVA